VCVILLSVVQQSTILLYVITAECFCAECRGTIKNVNISGHGILEMHF
jgi:hypothetical protein